MTGVIVDTNAHVAFKKGDPDAIDVIQHASVIAMSSIVLGELLSGFAVSKRKAHNEQELAQFLASSRVVILSISSTTAEYYAKIYADLRPKGKPIPTNDMWIAALARQHGYPVFTYDGHFDAVDGIGIVTNLIKLMEFRG
jgi:predicted nucleic acid-binding protein